MGRRKRQYQPQPFESSGKSKAYIAIYPDMMDSPAYHDLTPTQRDLYLWCKRQLYGQKDISSMPQHYFYFNRAMWCEKYQLYGDGNRAGFSRDMEALISHGFVDCVYSGKISRTKSIYRLSSRWQDYGTQRFTVPDDCITERMRKKKWKGMA